jgi:hypothetical protein
MGASHGASIQEVSRSARSANRSTHGILTRWEYRQGAEYQHTGAVEQITLGKAAASSVVRLYVLKHYQAHDRGRAFHAVMLVILA